MPRSVFLLPVKFAATLEFFYALGGGFLILPPGL